MIARCNNSACGFCGHYWRKSHWCYLWVSHATSKAQILWKRSNSPWDKKPPTCQHHCTKYNQQPKHIITQDYIDLNDDPLIQHQCNLHSRAHLIADSIILPLVHYQHGHLPNAIIHQPQPLQHYIANAHQMCHAIINEIMRTSLEYRKLTKWEKYSNVWVKDFCKWIRLPGTGHLGCEWNQHLYFIPCSHMGALLLTIGIKNRGPTTQDWQLEEIESIIHGRWPHLLLN